MAPAKPGGSAARARVRCAIYTRKSSEEGLEQDFNSLDAQREACQAYIASQRHEGWTALPDRYDDGGLSGASMERPALRRLLNAIDAGHIDAVVVYKVDRLTRSLGDFARIVEVFDARGVSFVSVTQQFNTTSSMGRLTLNMLLSFAQFEREVTGERIRDKIAASKKKGLWMGGLPPLGYDVAERELVVNEPEAETVRHVFRRYLELGSVHALRDALAAEGVAGKRRVDRHGRRTGGKPLDRGALYHLLGNRIYRGEIVHRDKSYAGRHPAIVGADLWEPVQARLAANRTARATGARSDAPSLLAGLLRDPSGARMTPSHASKGGRRYRYYVSQTLLTGKTGDPAAGRRVPAADLERLVEERIRSFLGSAAEVHAALEPLVPDGATRRDLAVAAADLAGRWSAAGTAVRRGRLLVLLGRIDVGDDGITLRLEPAGLPGMLSGAPTAHRAADGNTTPPVELTVAARVRRAGLEMRLLVDGADAAARRSPDRSLHRLLARAHQYRAMVLRGDGRTIAALAAEAGVTGSYFTRVLRLSFLAPDILEAILRDRHPLDLTARSLVAETKLPLEWADQRRHLGLDG